MDTNKAITQKDKSASQRISEQIAQYKDWRGELYGQLRQIILKADPKMKEEWKWGTAVWADNGMVCSAGAFKDHVRLNFFKGASVEDPKKLFNTGLDAKVSRGIDFYQGDKINQVDLKELVLAAVAVNMAESKAK